MLDHGKQMKECTETYLFHLKRHHKTLWNPSISELLLTSIQSLKLKIDMILHYILEHKLDLCFITEAWI